MRLAILFKFIVYLFLRFVKMLHLIKVVLFTILVVKVRENHAQIFNGNIELIPNVTEQVIPAGSELKLTCKVNRFGDGVISWQLPDWIVKYPEVSELHIWFFVSLNFPLLNLPFLIHAVEQRQQPSENIWQKWHGNDGNLFHDDFVQHKFQRHGIFRM